MEPTINVEYQKLVPTHSKEDYHNLKESIKLKGIWVSIIVNALGVILDGHTRYQIAKELGITNIPTVVREFDNPLEEKKFVIESNLNRRHLNDIQKIKLGIVLEPIEKALAKKRMSEGGKGKVGPNEPTLGKATEQVAKKIGVSRMTYERGKKVLESGNEELIKNVESGKTSISYAAKLVNRAEKHAAPPALPTGEFDVIYADPPWQYEIDTRGSPDEHYDVLTVEKICEMKVPSAKDSILFLWGTAPKLLEAIKVMQAWGFEYRTHAIWAKDKIGTGYYFRGQHEILLVGKKGNIPAPQEENRPSSIIQSPRTTHSTKPEKFYEIIEQMYPNRKYLEMFARNKRAKWTVWGDQA